MNNIKSNFIGPNFKVKKKCNSILLSALLLFSSQLSYAGNFFTKSFENDILGKWSIEHNKTEVFEFLEDNVLIFHTAQSSKPVKTAWVISKDLKVIILMNPGSKDEYRITGTLYNSKKIVMSVNGKKVTAYKICPEGLIFC